jgi:hypothetical protein
LNHVPLFTSALSKEENRVKDPVNEFLLPGRINELSHNSQEESLSERRQKEEMTSTIMVRLLKMVAL